MSDFSEIECDNENYQRDEQTPRSRPEVQSGYQAITNGGGSRLDRPAREFPDARDITQGNGREQT